MFSTTHSNTSWLSYDWPHIAEINGELMVLSNREAIITARDTGLDEINALRITGLTEDDLWELVNWKELLK